MQDVQTVTYTEILGDYQEPQRRSSGFPIYRVLFAIQAICIGIVFIAAKGWI